MLLVEGHEQDVELRRRALKAGAVEAARAKAVEIQKSILDLTTLPEAAMDPVRQFLALRTTAEEPIGCES